MPSGNLVMYFFNVKIITECFFPSKYFLSAIVKVEFSTSDSDIFSNFSCLTQAVYSSKLSSSIYMFLALLTASIASGVFGNLLAVSLNLAIASWFLLSLYTINLVLLML